MQYYPTISSAIVASSRGDRILVHPGVYNETVLLDRSVSLIGAGESNTVLMVHCNHGVVASGHNAFVW